MKVDSNGVEQVMQRDHRDAANDIARNGKWINAAAIIETPMTQITCNSSAKRKSTLNQMTTLIG